MNGAQESKETHFNDFPANLKTHLADQVKERQAYEGLLSLGNIRRDSLPPEEVQAYNEAMALLLTPRAFLTAYRSVIDDYHEGEFNLKTLLMRGSLRVGFNDDAALRHFDCTGPSRGGKSSLISRFLEFIPESRKIACTSCSPMADMFVVFGFAVGNVVAVLLLSLCFLTLHIVLSVLTIETLLVALSRGTLLRSGISCQQL